MYVGTLFNNVFSRVDRVCSNPRLQGARKNKFCEVTPNIYFSSFPLCKRCINSRALSRKRQMALRFLDHFLVLVYVGKFNQIKTKQKANDVEAV